MSLISLVVVLVVVGVLLWLVESFIPMDPTIKKIIRVVVIIAAVLYVLSAFGVFHGANDIKLPQVR